jgi:phosphatidylglycerol---prolipoprotein diacylglyceryl transferase
MIDEHFYPENWGILPYINLFGLKIPSYSLFILLALIVGIIIYYFESKDKKQLNENSLYIALAAIIGGTLGAKIPIWIINYKEIIQSFPDIGPLLSGRTIVGGLIGGAIGVVLIKKILKLKERKGNLFAPAIALGVAIGRIGCFLRGCCYGKHTILPWGVNFGDEILRHPTQIYESIFMIIMFIILQKKKKNAKPGELFKLLMISYFTFRFFIEFIRTETVVFWGLTGFQLVSIIVLLYLSRNNIKGLINRR